MEKLQDLTNAEELVMKSVWDLQKEPVLSEIGERVNTAYRDKGEEWRPQTVSTFLAKLVNKGYLKLQRNGKIYTYKVLVREEQYRKKLLNHMLHFWYQGDVDKMVDEI